jgi:16S rRNA C1402 N4-methylase RsmH
MSEHLVSLGLEKVQGVVLDVGVSSMQLMRQRAAFPSCAMAPLTCACRKPGKRC